MEPYHFVILLFVICLVHAFFVHPVPARHLIKFTTTSESFWMKRAESENVQFHLSYEIAGKPTMIVLIAFKEWVRIGLGEGEKKITIELFKSDDSIYFYPCPLL